MFWFKKRYQNRKNSGVVLMSDYQKETRIVNTRTGEVLGKNTFPVSPVFDEEKGYLFWPRKSFSKSFVDVDFPRELSFKEIGQMTTLAKKMCPKTNMLGYRGNGGSRPCNVDKIGAVVGLKPSQAYSFVRKMEKHGLIAEVKIRCGERVDTQYYVNPIYFFSGNRINLNLYLIFRRQLDPFLPGWVREKYREQGVK
jgi:hypothetical protein